MKDIQKEKSDLVAKNTPSGSTVEIFKLITGEEIIAKVTDRSATGGTLKLSTPVVAHIQPDSKTGSVSMFFAPWIPLADAKDGITIFMEHILLRLPVQTQVADAYEAQFGHRLVKANTVPNSIQV